MIVNHDLKYVAVSIPKTGSISVQFSLGFGHDIPEPDDYHMGIAGILAKFPEAASYFKFSFVRNPWARILSLYYDFTIKRKHQYSGKVRVDKPLFSEFKNFEDFCLNVGHSDWMNNVFFRSQTELLSVGGVMCMDFVGRFENLAGDFAAICDRIGVKANLLQMNLGEYSNRDYRSQFTPAATAAIGELYRKDVENFNYEF